jgi:hypothetical protein
MKPRNPAEWQEHQPLHKRYVLKVQCLLNHTRDRNIAAFARFASRTTVGSNIDLVPLPASPKNSRTLRNRSSSHVYGDSRRPAKIIRIISKSLPKQKRLVYPSMNEP